MKLFIIFIFIWISLVAGVSSIFAEKIILKDGREVNYELVIGYDDKEIKLKIENGISSHLWSQLEEQDAIRLTEGEYLNIKKRTQRRLEEYKKRQRLKALQKEARDKKRKKPKDKRNTGFFSFDGIENIPLYLTDNPKILVSVIGVLLLLVIIVIGVKFRKTQVHENDDRFERFGNLKRVENENQEKQKDVKFPLGCKMLSGGGVLAGVLLFHLGYLNFYQGLGLTIGSIFLASILALVLKK